MDDIRLEHLQSLIDNAAEESRVLDYKRDPYGDNEESRKNFLKDISAFANSSGGHLIIGMREEQGIACELTPFTVLDTDKEKLRLLSIIVDGIEPGLYGVNLRFVEIHSNQYCLIIYVPQSFNSPHRVSFKTKPQFWLRTPGGNAPMDFYELRTSFLCTGSLVEGAEKFRQERLATLGQRTPCPLRNGVRLILHIIPFSSLNSLQTVEIDDLDNLAKVPFLSDATGDSDWSFCIEGVCKHRSDTEKRTPTRNYSMLFRSGQIESLNIFSSLGDGPSQIDFRYEAMVVRKIPEFLDAIRQYGISAPLVIYLTLDKAQGAVMKMENWNSLELGIPNCRKNCCWITYISE
ncbi:AlbA family DNA-binding domain-containing protein [Geminicoccus flavidas]|uniref:AlbA family DNA-binding domain-containing protein n=1 Tax=Geminicoccus flavidas TaxID=2506407 RepID=UPI00135CBD46|nr:ATP-binding protein [Geminicoccus flavidas]